MLLSHYEAVSQADSREKFLQALVQVAHHLDFGRVGLALGTDNLGESKFVSLSNVPQGFEEAFLSVPDQKRDPVMQRVKSFSRPVLWSQSTYVDADAADLWDVQAPFGYKTGVCVALHLRDGKHVVVGIEREHPLPKSDVKLVRLLADVQLLAVHAQDAALRLLDTIVDIPRLTARELVVLRWLLAGKTNSVIAQIVGLSENTVEFHIKNLFRKLDCPNRHAAVIKARQLGIV
jgi:DNA-binding CsgD family transcriptional regulator